MTRRERIFRVISHKETDIIPYDFDLTSFWIDKLSEFYHTSDVLDFIGNHLAYTGVNLSREYLDNEVYRDEFGIIWRRDESTKKIGDWGTITDYPLKSQSLSNYSFPKPDLDFRFSHLIEFKSKYNDRFIIVGLDGLFDTAWHLRGFENLLLDFVDSPDFVNKLLDKSLDFILGIIEKLNPKIIDGVRFVEDWGKQEGLLMGPTYWRKFLKPRLKEMYKFTREKGIHVFIHSCGDIEEIFPDLIEMRVEVVHPIQPEVMDLNLIKREYGKDICLYGGIGCQSTLPLGNMEDVRREIIEKMEVLSKGSGYILGPAGAIPNDVPIENVTTFIEIAQKQDLRKTINKKSSYTSD